MIVTMLYIMYVHPILCIIVGNHDNNVSGDSTRDIEPERCGAYEIVRLSKQKVVTNENPAYGEVGKSNL